MRIYTYKCEGFFSFEFALINSILPDLVIFCHMPVRLPSTLLNSHRLRIHQLKQMEFKAKSLCYEQTKLIRNKYQELANVINEVLTPSLCASGFASFSIPAWSDQSLYVVRRRETVHFYCSVTVLQVRVHNASRLVWFTARYGSITWHKMDKHRFVDPWTTTNFQTQI